MTDYLALAMEQDRDQEEPKETLAEELREQTIPAGVPKPSGGTRDGEGPGGGRLAEEPPLWPEDRSPMGEQERFPGGEERPGAGGPEPEEKLPEGIAMPRTLLPGAILPAPGRSGMESLPPDRERREGGGAEGLLSQMRRAERGAGFVQTQRRAIAVTLPEQLSAAPAWSAEEFDRTVERDARRYGGGFGLY